MRKTLAILGPVLALTLFALALIVLRHQLHGHSYHEIMSRLRSLPPGGLLAALALTACNYSILTCYDLMAFRYIGKKLAYAKIAMTSFIAYAYSNSIGLAALSGGSIRFRFYTAFGLSSVEIAQVIGFGILTFWLGFSALAGIGFLTRPPVVPEFFHLSPTFIRALGAGFVLFAGGYLSFAALRTAPLTVKNWLVRLPSFRLTAAQLAISAVDWGLAAGILFVLMPRDPQFGYFDFLPIYLLAHIAGIISQVPGGLGVFETAIVVFIRPFIPVPDALGALLAYRAIYYFLPLAFASVLLAWRELSLKRALFARGADLLGKLIPGIVPQGLALLTFAGGAVLLLSGATPAAGERLTLLNTFLPLPILEISHFLASLGGVGLLILALGLQRRLDASYHMALFFLAAGMVFSLLKGLDFEEALILAVMFWTLRACRKEFYRKASLLNEPFSAGWIAAIMLVIGTSVWLGFFSYKHVEYSSDLWWRFEFAHDAPRFLRASVGAAAAAFIFALAKLMRPVRPEPRLPGADELARALAIASASPDTGAYLALLGDKELLFSENGGAFLMYAVQGASWVALGNPVGPREAGQELLWKFMELCDRHGGRPVFYQVSGARLPDYIDLGLSPLKLGEEGRVPLAGFSLEGGARKDLRQTVNKIEKAGFEFRVAPPEETASLMPELRRVSADWLSGKKTREKGFSLGFFKEDYLRMLPCALVKKGDSVVAFANIWPGGGKEELSTDLMRHSSAAPAGAMDYLFTKLMLWGREQGYAYLDLGMAPLSGFHSHALAPLRDKVGAFLYRHGEDFYNFQGLRAYKEKFDPVWEPRYLASRGGLSLPRILLDVTALISGSLKGAVAK